MSQRLKVHKGEQSKHFSWVAHVKCQFHGARNKEFLYSTKWAEVTCKRCLNLKGKK